MRGTEGSSKKRNALRTKTLQRQERLTKRLGTGHEQPSRVTLPMAAVEVVSAVVVVGVVVAVVREVLDVAGALQ